MMEPHVDPNQPLARKHLTMSVQTRQIEFSTQGSADILLITEQVAAEVAAGGLRHGAAILFTPSATSAVTTIEWEPGAVSDFRRLLDEIAGPERSYQHNLNQGDGNGHAHVRAALLGPSLAVPVVDGRLALGRWQEIIFADFDNRPRQRRLLLQLIGES